MHQFISRCKKITVKLLYATKQNWGFIGMVETNKKKMQKIAMKSMKIHQEVSYFLIFLSPHSLSTPSSAKPPFNCHRHYDGAKMNQQSRPWFPKYGEQN